MYPTLSAKLITASVPIKKHISRRVLSVHYCTRSDDRLL